MKKNYIIRTLLGVTQEDIAQLLGVSRTQWSMFEIGRRDLPLPAMQFLAEMLVFVQSPEMVNKTLQPSAQQQEKIQLTLEDTIRENDFQQLKTSKKITVLTKKQQSQQRLSQLLTFLESQNSKHDRHGIYELLLRKSSQFSGTESFTDLANLEMRLELLQLEKLLLQAQLRKITSTVDLINN